MNVNFTQRFPIRFAHLFFFVLFPYIAQTQNLSIVKQDSGVIVLKDGKDLFFYRSAPKSIEGKYQRSNYIHPLYGLNGEVLTEDFPEDHLHQRGIYWAWHQVIAEEEWMGDGWDCRGIRWDVEKTKAKREGKALKLYNTVSWYGFLPSKGKEDKLFKEFTTITVNAEREDAVELDFEISLTALHWGSKLGGSNDEKGYGGFSARVVLPEDIRFLAKKGEVEAQNLPVKAGNWIQMRGSFAPEAESQSCITIMNHPDNPLPFQGWILRKKASMQNAAWPGRNSVFLQKNTPLILHYKILIHDEFWTSSMIEEYFRAFASKGS
ncbi:MAG: DUF6807 family protein [Bacteroidota bacterium]